MLILDCSLGSLDRNKPLNYFAATIFQNFVAGKGLNSDIIWF